MKGIEITLDGVKYFVTVETFISEGEYGSTQCLKVGLYLGSLRSNVIYSEVDRINEYGKYDVKKAKKFIKRALAKV